MAEIVSENTFQEWLLALYQGHAHIQRHDYSQYPDIPDISVGFRNAERWLELKYATFKLPHPPRRYGRFHFKETTRGQLHWMVSREYYGKISCGVLGYFSTGPHTRYLSYIPADMYLVHLWKDTGITAAAAVLSNWTTGFDVIRHPDDMEDFIREASRAWSVQR